MNTREDFEIYTIKKNDRIWYRFKVDYFGVYTSPSEKIILRLRQQVKKQVKARLEWVERENKKYYARLAKQECQRALLLKEAKDLERKGRTYKNPLR